MAQSSLLSLPVSFITALISVAIFLLILRSSAGNKTSRWCFALLFASFALQAVMVGLRFGYGIEAVISLQRALPFTVGLLAYLGFRALINPDILMAKTFPCHIGAMLGLIGICLILPAIISPEQVPTFFLGLIDFLITASYVTYLILLMMLFRLGPDAFEEARFETIERTRGWLLAAILLLLGLIVLDTIIALDFMLFAGREAATLITIGHLLMIPILIAAALFYPRISGGGVLIVGKPEPAIAESNERDDRSLLDEINRLLIERKLYQDPDLNLSRVARRLSVPARRVSEAINRELGMNVSQFVNDHRVRAAMAGLRDQDSAIGDVMLAAGFRTKSNFNREFKRVTGENPKSYRLRHRRLSGD